MSQWVSTVLIADSTDGITWNETIDQSNATLFSCVYGDSYICGGDGAVMRAYLECMKIVLWNLVM